LRGSHSSGVTRMPRKVIRGSGITARLVTEWGGELGEDDFLEGIMREQGPEMFLFDPVIAEVERWAREILDRARLEKRAFRFDDDSLESYAFRFDHYVGIVRDCIRRGDANKAARFALIVGELLGEARIKFRVEARAMVGINRMRANQKIARDRKTKLHDIKVKSVLNEVGRGITLQKIAGRLKCSQSHLSGILKPYGGVAEIRKQYRRTRAAR
jgi:AraC-like DNA-binding protein